MTVLGIGFAIVLLLTASISKGAEYYKHVDEVMTSVDSWRGKKLQVHGHVVDGSIEQAKGTLLYRFKIESRPPRAPAVITADLHRPGPRHLQERRRGRGQGHR